MAVSRLFRLRNLKKGRPFEGPLKGPLTGLLKGPLKGLLKEPYRGSARGRSPLAKKAGGGAGGAQPPSLGGGPGGAPPGHQGGVRGGGSPPGYLLAPARHPNKRERAIYYIMFSFNSFLTFKNSMTVLFWETVEDEARQ